MGDREECQLSLSRNLNFLESLVLTKFLVPLNSKGATQELALRQIASQEQPKMDKNGSYNVLGRQTSYHPSDPGMRHGQCRFERTKPYTCSLLDT